MFSSRSSRRLTNALLALVSTGLAVCAVEVVARMMGAGTRFGQLLNIRDVATRTVNGVPLWSPQLPRYDSDDLQRVAQNRDAFTILGLGDSILYGVGQPREATYLEQARRSLAGRSSRRVEVLNLAVPGFNTAQENAVYAEVDEQIRPDLVLVHYWVDDVHQYRAVGGYVVDVGNVSAEAGRLVVRALPVPAPINDFLLGRSRVYALLTEAVVAGDLRGAPPDWARVAEPLAAIHDRARRAGARMLVLVSPDLNGKVPQPVADLPALREFAALRGVEIIDLSEWLRGIESKDIAMDGVHFNAPGHRVVGERLADYLLQRDLKD